MMFAHLIKKYIHTPHQVGIALLLNKSSKHPVSMSKEAIDKKHQTYIKPCSSTHLSLSNSFTIRQSLKQHFLSNRHLIIYPFKKRNGKRIYSRMAKSVRLKKKSVYVVQKKPQLRLSIITNQILNQKRQKQINNNTSK